jgi:hypothetical protein
LPRAGCDGAGAPGSANVLRGHRKGFCTNCSESGSVFLVRRLSLRATVTSALEIDSCPRAWCLARSTKTTSETGQGRSYQCHLDTSRSDRLAFDELGLEVARRARSTFGRNWYTTWTPPSSRLQPGDAVDFWRVLLADRAAGRLILYAEMKLPGEAWLEFHVSEHELVQTATFRPRGLYGRVYWYLCFPFHAWLFPRMARQLVT